MTDFQHDLEAWESETPFLDDEFEWAQESNLAPTQELESPFVEEDKFSEFWINEEELEPEIAWEDLDEFDEEAFDEDAEGEAFAEFSPDEEVALESEAGWEHSNVLGVEEYYEEAEEDVFAELDINPTEEIEPEFLDQLSEDEIDESAWRMRPPVRYQAHRYICWAEALSSWSMVTKGVRKFKRGREVIDFFKSRGVVNADESLKLPKGMEEAQRVFGLKFKKFEQGGHVSAINWVPMLRHSHLIVVFRRPGAKYYHFVVVYGVDRFHICFMDPELDPLSSSLDKVKKNRVCARLENFGAGADEFWVFWKEKAVVKETLEELETGDEYELQLSGEFLDETDEEDFYEESDLEAFDDFSDQMSINGDVLGLGLELSDISLSRGTPADYNNDEALFIAELFESQASNLKEKFTWYQTFLRIVEKKDIAVDGSWGSQSKQALKSFQKKYGLTVGGISPQTTLAIIQISLEWIYLHKINNKLGTKSQNLREAIKKFQKDYNITVDGRVGPQARAVMVQIFNQNLPRQILYSSSKCDKDIKLNSRQKVSNIWANPYRWICLLRVFKEDPDTGKLKSGVGTGFLISPQHILTAAHNLHWSVTGSKNTVQVKTAKKVEIYLDKNTKAFAHKLFIPHKWKNSLAPTNKLDSRYDFAMIKLKHKVDKVHGYWKVIIDPDFPARFKGAGAGYPIDHVYLSGYPCDKRTPTNSYPQWKSEVSGQFIKNGLVFFNSDIASGNSGGPIWETRTINKINNKKQIVVVGIVTSGYSESWWQHPLYMPIEAAGMLNGVWLSPTLLQQFADWDSKNLKVTDNTLEYIGS